MAGIFSRGFGFPSTSLAAAAEATANGSAGSRAGAGPRPARRPPPVEGRGNARVGELGAIRRAHLRGARMLRRTGRGAQLVQPGWMLQPGLTPLRGGLFKGSGRSGPLPFAILLLGTRGLESHTNLSLHLRSEEAPLEERRRGRTPPAPGGCGVSRRGKRAAAGGKERTAEEGEGGRTEPKTSQDHRETAASLIASTAVSPATQRCGESPRKVSLGVTVSHHCPEAPWTDRHLNA